MKFAPTVLVCPSGHEVQVPNGVIAPLACPACVKGIQCGLALTRKGAR